MYTMSFYVSRWPDQCDPRDGHMGHEILNGIQTPPARLFFEDRGPGTPVSNWTYNGPLATFQALPAIVPTLFTAPCTPRFVRWRGVRFFTLGVTFSIIIVDIRKKERSLFTVDPWDSYWVELTLNGLLSDNEIEFRQLSDTDYSRYQQNTPGDPWTWTNGGAPFQTVSWTEFWPVAWNLVAPGPPFVPGL